MKLKTFSILLCISIISGQFEDDDRGNVCIHVMYSLIGQQAFVVVIATL